MRQDGGVGIGTEECWDLLRGASMGRIALSLGALPAILPIQYYVDGNELAICLGHYSISLEAVDETVIAFAADRIDPQTRSGWSVQALGKIWVAGSIGVPVDCGQPDAGQIVHLSPRKVTGQRVQLCPFGSTLDSLM